MAFATTQEHPQLGLAAVKAIRYDVLTGKQWEDALQGAYGKNWKRLKAAWLHSPSLKYYRPAFLLRGEDHRVFFVASVASDDADDSRRIPVGLAEISIFDDPQEYGLKYISVAPQCQRMGVASRLYEMLIEHVQKSGKALYRSGRGKDTPAEFTEYITAKLNESGLVWRQGTHH